MLLSAASASLQSGMALRAVRRAASASRSLRRAVSRRAAGSPPARSSVARSVTGARSLWLGSVSNSANVALSWRSASARRSCADVASSASFGCCCKRRWASLTTWAGGRVKASSQPRSRRDAAALARSAARSRCTFGKSVSAPSARPRRSARVAMSVSAAIQAGSKVRAARASWAARSSVLAASALLADFDPILQRIAPALFERLVQVGRVGGLGQDLLRGSQAVEPGAAGTDGAQAVAFAGFLGLFGQQDFQGAGGLLRLAFQGAPAVGAQGGSAQVGVALFPVAERVPQRAGAVAGGGLAEVVALAFQIGQQVAHPAHAAAGGEQHLAETALAADEVAAAGAEQAGVEAEQFAKDGFVGAVEQALCFVRRDFRSVGMGQRIAVAFAADQRLRCPLVDDVGQQAHPFGAEPEGHRGAGFDAEQEFVDRPADDRFAIAVGGDDQVDPARRGIEREVELLERAVAFQPECSQSHQDSPARAASRRRLACSRISDVLPAARCAGGGRRAGRRPACRAARRARRRGDCAAGWRRGCRSRRAGG